jgi:hypothetical protein
MAFHRNLKPGDWVKFQDTTNRLYSEDGTLKANNNLLKMMTSLIDACGRVGLSGDFTPRIKGEVEHAGFTKVEEHTFKVPVGTWPKNKRMASWPRNQLIPKHESLIHSRRKLARLPLFNLLGVSKG